MRRKLPAILLILSCLPAVPAVSASEPVVMVSTPTGAGDPDAMVCRAPQHIAGSGQLGSQVCLQNSEWWKVAMNGKDIAPDGKTLIDRPTVKTPTGEGDPDAITCRTPQFVSGGPPVKICRLNSFWADAIKNHQVVDARGNVVPRIWNTNYGPLYGPGGYPIGGGGAYDSGQVFGQWAPYDSGHVQAGQPPPPSPVPH